MSDAKKVLCYGEVLWDCLPAGLFFGGAPVNVAYHLRQKGSKVFPVTAVGKDFLGEEIFRRMRRFNLELPFVSEIPEKATGVVLVQINEQGNASYDIREDVAWDYIPCSETLLKDAEDADAIVFGSLAQRSPNNRETLTRLLDHGQTALKIFDVNLRPPYDDPDRVFSLCIRADLIKMNGDELRTLTGSDGKTSNVLGNLARNFRKRVGDKKICITDGAAGAGLLDGEKWFWEDGQKVQVEDTVGAGDSFLAALTDGLLAGDTPAQALKNAARLGEFVASSRGATPSYHWEGSEIIAG